MAGKPEFNRETIIAAGRTMDRFTQGDVDAFLLDYGLEDARISGAVQARATRLIRHLLENPEVTTGPGENLTDAVVRDLVERAASRRVPPEEEDTTFAERYPRLGRALDRDGFVVKDGRLIRAMPSALGLPAADDEIHQLLKRFNFSIPLGHLDQAIQNHTDGRWASANSQVRSFVYALVDEIAERLAPPGAALPPPGGARLNWLGGVQPPFVLRAFNEWDGQGKGFFEAFIRRLQPHGAHPGLSEEEDATFRLHTALIAARLLLRRLAQRFGG